MIIIRRLIIFAGLAGIAFSQDPRGKITGVLIDASQAAVPNAEIRATNADTGVTAVSKSNEAGNYTLPFLLPGMYRITAEAPGFKRFSREGVQVRVSETVALQIQMEVGT